MTEVQFFTALLKLYRVGNNSDHESNTLAWTKPSMVADVCQPIDNMLHRLVASGVISADDRQKFLDSV